MSAADDDEALESAESSSSDSELEDIEASEEDIAALTQLEEELGTNPNLYDKHTEVWQHTGRQDLSFSP